MADARRSIPIGTHALLLPQQAVQAILELKPDLLNAKVGREILPASALARRLPAYAGSAADANRVWTPPRRCMWPPCVDATRLLVRATPSGWQGQELCPTSALPTFASHHPPDACPGLVFPHARVELLLKDADKVDLSIKDAQGRSPLDLAATEVCGPPRLGNTSILCPAVDHAMTVRGPLSS